MACTVLIRGSPCCRRPLRNLLQVCPCLCSRSSWAEPYLPGSFSFLISIYLPLICSQLSCLFLFSIFFLVCLLVATKKLVTPVLNSPVFSLFPVVGCKAPLPKLFPASPISAPSRLFCYCWHRDLPAVLLSTAPVQQKSQQKSTRWNLPCQICAHRLRCRSPSLGLEVLNCK